MKFRLKTYATAVAVILAVACTSGFGQESPHGEISVACEDCHTSTSWKQLASPMKFSHDRTKFALRGQHEQVQCVDCHASLTFTGAATGCGDCHKDVHRGELGANCERCHSPQSWLVPDMPQRHVQTRFALVGRHLTAPCRACHTNEQKYEYVSVPTECYNCHRVQYDATTVPSHRAVGFGTDCASCHSMNAMRFEGSFDHNKTGFALVGAHAAQQCSACHTGNRFVAMSAQCVNCHQQDFTTASNPKHTGYPTDCTSCHSMNAWHPATFDHNKTSFPLTGAHQGVSCGSCHKNNQYAGTSTACYTCHQQNFTTANAPVHTGFPTDCTTCHTTTAWQPSIFDHSKTAFPLSGAHLAVACASCHTNNQYAGTPTQCYSCHQQDFTTANAPPHTGFSTTCTTCHTMTAWQPATFDHSKTTFPLTGAHQTAACAQCHVNNVYAGLNTQCVGCHQANYAATTNPVHSSAGFGTDCQTCHTTTAWQPATFNHDTFFPVSATARHRQGSVWTTCADCHTNSSNYSVFCCTNCHTHTQSRTDPEHVGRNGYTFTCTSCYSCHPRGNS